MNFDVFLRVLICSFISFRTRGFLIELALKIWNIGMDTFFPNSEGKIINRVRTEDCKKNIMQMFRIL